TAAGAGGAGGTAAINGDVQYGSSVTLVADGRSGGANYDNSAFVYIRAPAITLGTLAAPAAITIAAGAGGAGGTAAITGDIDGAVNASLVANGGSGGSSTYNSGYIDLSGPAGSSIST